MTVYNLAPGVVLHHADMRDALKTLPDNSIDSVVCDPPYHLTTGKKGGTGEASLDPNSPAGRARISTGFMGRVWDGGDIAFRPETWAEVLRVLKPGGYCAAFGAPRNFGRLQCAIYEAGFEERDTILHMLDPDDAVVQFIESLNEAQLDAFMRCLGQSEIAGFLAWSFGTGFPKSLDVSKAIDKAGPNYQSYPEFGAHYAAKRIAAGLSHAQVCELGKFYANVNHGGTSVNWEKGYSLPNVPQWEILAPALQLDESWRAVIVREEYEREVTGQISGSLLAVAPGQDNDRSATVLNITRAGSPAAATWSGWGTALKPAFEPIVLARKPLSEGTIAANVLRWRTGALNIGASRVPGEARVNSSASSNEIYGQFKGAEAEGRAAIGRWPANVVHDGSDEVVGAFPFNASPPPKPRYGGFREPDAIRGNVDFKSGSRPTSPVDRGDSGSAARFFYSAKASRADRNGSKHPTVKPISLMEWLCTLITPPGGVVLDPFAGSGTTGAAATRRGFQVVLCEREAEYVQDIRARFGCRLSFPLDAVRAELALLPRLAALRSRLQVRA